MTTEPRRVRLLASVTSEAEARLAASHGADIVDCKNPAEGALGALPHETVTAIRAALPASVPVSATIGDLTPEPAPVLEAARAMAATGADIVKIGFFPGGDAHATIRHLGCHLAASTPLIAVLMADAEGPLDIAMVSALGEAGFAGVMLDTAVKDGRTLLDHRTPEELAAFLEAAAAAGLMAGLAGSLKLTQIPALLTLEPDVLGFRGALCRASDRARALDADALSAVRRAIPRMDYRGATGVELETTL
ncbi:(5-formylfuran-3-yl)methyl phosphate synthase [Hyphomicrobium nitrativorans]|uniref:(5-formylfuran-3-yl)methyl phosphate synthase n=1 Tax=Hyphomicrobium nitrativorans TaxID=1427356 RepID=UPI00059BFA04|nr:(5-formylfuran-3-yl)methyl phosphate synthase [Hyphomicrobium nitrativorans]